MQNRRTVLASAAALSLTRAAGARAAETPAARFDKAADYSEAHGGCGMLVMIGGDIVYERYARGHTGDTAIFIASATKSFWGVATAAAIEDGLVSSFDELAVETLTEWRGDPRKSKITLRQILSLTSGMHNDIAAIQGEGAAPDKYAFAVSSPLDDDPGATFTYGPVNFYLLGEILKRKLKARKQDPLAYLDDRILKPIGLRYGQWTRDQAGNPHIPNGCYVSARQWVKFGRLILAHGRYEGRQLVRADLLAQCFEPNPVNPAYGLAFWLNRPGGILTGGRAGPRGSAGGALYGGGQTDLAGAMGAGPNNLYIFPSLDMAVVKQSPATLRPSDRTFQEHRREQAARQRGYSHSAFVGLVLTGQA